MPTRACSSPWRSWPLPRDVRGGRRDRSRFFERLRWLYAIQTEGEAYTLNNIYRAPYARLLMATFPELEGFFEVRQGTEDYSGLTPERCEVAGLANTPAFRRRRDDPARRTA